mgnify:CR=1 FL=1
MIKPNLFDIGQSKVFKRELFLNNMNNLLQKIWNYDFDKIKIPDLTLWWIVVGGLVAYFGLNEEVVFSLNHLFDKYSALHPEFENFKYITISITVFLVIFVVVLLILHDRRASKEIGRQRLYGIIVPHIIVNIIDALILAVVVFAIGFAGEKLFSMEVNILDLRSLDTVFLPFQHINQIALPFSFYLNDFISRSTHLYFSLCYSLV